MASVGVFVVVVVVVCLFVCLFCCCCCLFCFFTKKQKSYPRYFLQFIGWDSLEQIRPKQLAISVFKSLNNLYSEGLKNMFKPNSRVHSHNVRSSSNNVFVPRPRTEAAKRAFSYRGGCHVEWP